MSDDVRSSSEDADAPLQSWKEIAAYLNKDVSTVKRWEKQEGLPIHRHLHRLRSSVYAHRSELQLWRANRRPAASPVPPLRRWWGRPASALGYAALTAVALVSAGDGYAVGPGQKAASKPARLTERRVLTQRDMDLNNFFDLKPSPDGRRVAYSATGTEEGALYLRELDSGKTTRLTTGASTRAPIWSPDAKRLAYRSRRSGAAALEVLVLANLATSVVTAIDGTDVRPLDWSPDGAELLCSVTHADGTSSLVRVGFSKGGMLTLISQGWTAASTASYSPDGRYIVFSAAEGGQQEIYVIAVDGSRKERITQGPGSSTSPLWSPAGDTVLYQRNDGVWAVRVVGGRPQGAARLIRTARFDQPVAWTTAGLFYVRYNTLSAAYVATPDPQGSNSAASRPQPLDLGLDQIDRFVWSPDMTRLAVSRAGDSRIYEYSVLDRSLRSFATGAERYPSTLSWSGDGRSILFETYQSAAVLAVDHGDGRVHSLFAPIPGAERFDIARSGKAMLFYEGGHESGRRRLMLSALGEPFGRALASEMDSAGAFSNWVRPAFSPNGSQVLFGRTNRDEDTLWILSADGSGLRKVATVRHRSRTGPGPAPYEPFLHYAIWSPDGGRIAYDDARSVFVVEIGAGGEQRLALPLEFTQIGVVSWSPDGRQIGLRGRSNHFELWAVDGSLVMSAVSAGSGER